MSKRMTVIEIQKENMKFSSAHFTIFSETEREPLHGHNYYLYIGLHTEVVDNGLSYDYRRYKKRAYELCRELTQHVLLPMYSKYLEIKEDDTHYHLRYGQDTMMLMKKDVKLLPICNITVEELSNWFLQRLIEDEEALKRDKIEAIDVKIFTGPGQSGSSHWVRASLIE